MLQARPCCPHCLISKACSVHLILVDLVCGSSSWDLSFVRVSVGPVVKGNLWWHACMAGVWISSCGTNVLPQYPVRAWMAESRQIQHPETHPTIVSFLWTYWVVSSQERHWDLNDVVPTLKGCVQSVLTLVFVGQWVLFRKDSYMRELWLW